MASSPILFETILAPHCSLSHRGFRRVIGSLGLLSLIVGIYCYWRGAWPVIGFCGLDVLLAYWALKLSYRRGRAREIIRLTREVLTIERVAANGKNRLIKLPSYWLRVELEDKEETIGALKIINRGREISIGNFLGPEARCHLKMQLSEALPLVRTAEFLSHD